MTEFNPAAEAEKIAAQAKADLEKAGTEIKTEAETIKTDVTGDVAKALSEVKPAETTVLTDVTTIKTDAATGTTTAADALKTAQAGVAQGFAAAKTDTATAIADAHSAAEAEALKAKTPPPLPAGSILGDAAKPAPAPAKPAVLVTNTAMIEAAITSIKSAQQSIAGCGNVNSDLALAAMSCVKAIEWLNKALSAAAAPKA